MQTLPAALAGLAAYPQFIVYTLVPSSTRPGKTDKFPIRWQDGRKWSAHDPAIWLTADAAFAQVAAGRGHGVGFVFTVADPFFFIDIDGALTPGGEWSPLTQQLCAAFPGAGVEVSQSGAGLHIIGRGICPPHSCDYNVPGSGTVQFYTERRFVALTGTHACGDVNADMSHVLPWLVQHFFPYVEPIQPADWDKGAREDWRGSTDDDELIRRALKSQSAAAVFGTKASFADLWEGNDAVLAHAYPSESGDTYGRSHADAALASHLAFWTGCDCARIERLMRRSALLRDKWDEHRPGGTYLTVTISKAVTVQRDVCHDKEVTAPGLLASSAGDAAPTEAVAAGTARTSATFLHPAQQVEFFAGCVYVQDSHRVFVPSGALLKPEQFKAWYGGHVFVMDANNEKTTRNAWEAFTESNVISFPRVNRSWFRPDLPPGSVAAHEGLSYVNTYVPVNVDRFAGDPTPFLIHLEKVLPVVRDREIMLAYMAACVQHVGVKFQWAPMLQGCEGNGKSLFSRCVEKAIGERYSHWPRADQISTKFNSWLANRLFIGVEDVYLKDGQEEVIEVLKPMITSDRQPVEPKGVDQFSTYVWCNFILNTNYKRAVVKAKQGDGRRIAPFLTPHQKKEDLKRDGMTDGYFPRLYRWLKQEGGYGIVADFLYRYPIPAELNPAIGCPVAPNTSSSTEVAEGHIGAIEQEIAEAIGAERPGFMGGWISSFAFDGLLAKMNRQRMLSHRQREEILNELGYIKHPALQGGRVNNVVAPDAGKPILFVRVGSPELKIVAPAEVARAYSAAQGVTFTIASHVPPPVNIGNSACH
jgi:hypothetical protein